MIDEEWVRSLSFSMEGCQISSVLGMGSQNIVFEAHVTDPSVFAGRQKSGHPGADDSKLAVTVPRDSLWLHARLFPPFSSNPISSINEKNVALARMLGDPFFDQYSRDINTFYLFLLKTILEKDYAGIIFGFQSDQSVDGVPFVMQTPGIQRRLKDLAEWPDPDPDDAKSGYPTITNEHVTIFFNVLTDREKAKSLLNRSSMIPDPSKFKPGDLHQNPLFIWLAAILDGLIDSEEDIDASAEYINHTFGRASESEDAFAQIMQLNLFLDLIVNAIGDLKRNDFRRLKLAGTLFRKCGFDFPLFHKSGVRIF